MPFLIALLGIAGAVYFFVIRARNAAHMAGELADVANDVRLAARRFGFSRRSNIHPAESIEDPDIAIAGIGWAFLQLDDLPSAEQQLALKKALHQERGLPLNEAEELMVLGRWMVEECGGPAPAVARLSRKLQRLGPKDADHVTPLLAVLNTIGAAGSGQLSAAQRSALEDLRRAFRLS